MPLQNAKDTLLSENPGTLPNMQGALLDWFQSMTFSVVTKTVINAQVVETKTQVSTKAVRQPFTSQQLLMKPEGQRHWKWETLHAFPDCVLVPDDIVIFAGGTYRVMQKRDWKEYGYVEYHICQGYS